MTGDDKYSLLNKDNLLQHFQIQLSQKPQNFSEIFFEFSKFRFNSDHLEKKKGDPNRWCVSELSDSEKYGSINV